MRSTKEVTLARQVFITAKWILINKQTDLHSTRLCIVYLMQVRLQSIVSEVTLYVTELILYATVAADYRRRRLIKSCRNEKVNI